MNGCQSNSGMSVPCQDVAGCTNVQAVMNLTNAANVPFDNQGYLSAKTQCRDVYSDRRKTLDPAEDFPMWPLEHGKMYPTMDYTNDMYPVLPDTALDMDINDWEDVTANWPPKAVPLEPYGQPGPASELQLMAGTMNPDVSRQVVMGPEVPGSQYYDPGEPQQRQWQQQPVHNVPVTLPGNNTPAAGSGKFTRAVANALRKRKTRRVGREGKEEECSEVPDPNVVVVMGGKGGRGGRGRRGGRGGEGVGNIWVIMGVFFVSVLILLIMVLSA